MKLHLGCGQVYLDGYINIDYPLTHHSVQKKSMADIHHDIKTLKYKSNTVDEIRLHHVFEHFDRATSCALISIWRSWLKPEGILHIEVPNFTKTAKAALSALSSSKNKKIAFRHIFGSQEADWAVHYHGWTIDSLTELLKIYEFEIVKIKENAWKGTYNLEVLAKKNRKNISKIQSVKIGSNWLRSFLVDNSSGEKELLTYWIGLFNKQINTGWAK